MPNSWNKFEGNVAAIQFPAGVAAGRCYQILSVSNNKRRGDGVWQRCWGRMVLLQRPCCPWRREEQFITASEAFNTIFSPSCLDCAPLSDICNITKIDFMAESEYMVFSSAVFLRFDGFFQ